MITSLQNPKIKAVVQLHQRKYRDERGLILIEGRHPVEEALHSGIILEEIYLREGESPFSSAACEQLPVTEVVMAKISTTESPPPVLAVAKRPAYTPLEPTLQSEVVFVLGLIGLQDPGNLGTLIRSACAFGMTAVFLVGEHVDPFHPKVIRASAGMVFRLPFACLDNLERLIDQLQEHSELQVWGADPHQGESYHQVCYGNKTMLLLGGEAHGLPGVIWQAAKPLHIPMRSGVESLNVGVAGAIILAEIYQQQLR